MNVETAVAAAFIRAGISAEDVALEVALSRFFNNGGTVERAHALLQQAAARLSGKGHAVSAEYGQAWPAQPRQADPAQAGAGGQLPCAIDGQTLPAPSDDPASAGGEAIRHMPAGHSARASPSIPDYHDGQEEFVCVVRPIREENGRFLPKDGIVARTPRRKARALVNAAERAEVTLESVFHRELGGFGRRIGLISRRIAREGRRRFNLDSYTCELLETEIAWPDDTTPLEAFASEDEVKALFRRAYDRLGSIQKAGAS